MRSISGPNRSARPLDTSGLSFPDFADLGATLTAEQADIARNLPVLLDVSQIEHWTLTQAKQDSTYVAALRSVYNSAVPLHSRLPVELLIHVLVLTGRAWRKMGKLRLRLLHVCRYWRSILLQTSEFWADMSSIPSVLDSEELLQVVVDRSGSRPFPLVPTSPPRRAFLCGEKMRPHLHRITHLLVPFDLIASEWQLLLFGDRQSLLRTLDFSRVDPASLDALKALLHNSGYHLAAALPYLRELSLPADLLPHLAADTLDTLFLLQPSDRQRPSGHLLGRTLVACARRLRSLGLHPHALPAEWLSFTGTTPIPLPVLGTLRLVDTDCVLIRSFLEHVRFPYAATCVRIDAAPYSAPWPVHEKFRHVLPESMVEAVVDAADRVCVDHSGSQHVLRACHGRRELLMIVHS